MINWEVVAVARCSLSNGCQAGVLEEGTELLLAVLALEGTL
jgi:hypothetical protein